MANAPSKPNAPSGQSAAQQAYQQNMAARQAIIPSPMTKTIDSWRVLPSQTVTNYIAGQQTVLQFVPFNYGFLKRFLIKVTATLVQGAAETQTRVSCGPANILSNITYLDTSNQPRTNCHGWWLHAMASKRRRYIFGSASTTDTPTGWGANWSVITAPASFTTSNSTFVMWYEVPIAYGDRDLRGLVYANTTNATQSLSVTINPGFYVASGADPTFAGYRSSTAQLGVITTLTVTVYQNCIDQIAGLPLPLQDLGTQYCITDTFGGNPTVSQDFVMSYANFRSFYGTGVLYDNNGTLNVGNDINYFYIRSANGMNLIQWDPNLTALQNRNAMSDDPQAGLYLFDHAHDPISTNEFGNMAIVVNPAVVSSPTGSQLYFGYEYMQKTASLPNQQIIPAGN